MKTHRLLCVLAILFCLSGCISSRNSNSNDDYEGESPKSKSLFSNEPTNKDVKKVWESEVEVIGEGSQNTYNILQIWKNTRKDYSTWVDIQAYLLGTDGTILVHDFKDIAISPGETGLVYFVLRNDTGSKADKVEVTPVNVSWHEYDKPAEAGKIDISKPTIDVESGTPEITMQVTNNSDFKITNVTATFLILMQDGTPAAIKKTIVDISIPYGQTDKVSSVLALPDWVNRNLEAVDDTGKVKYWLSYTTHEGIVMTISGESTIDLSILIQ